MNSRNDVESMSIRHQIDIEPIKLSQNDIESTSFLTGLPLLGPAAACLSTGTETESLLFPAADVDYNTLVHEIKDRVSAYHLILDATLTPALEGASMPPPRFTQVAWSPQGLLHYGRSVSKGSPPGRAPF